MHTLAHTTAHTQANPPLQDSAQLSSLDDAQLSALDDALHYRPSGANRRTHFTRVIVRRPGSKTYTTVDYKEDYGLVAMRFAYGEEKTLNAALRAAALVVKETRRGYVSSAVRAKALAILRGNYCPAKAAALAKSDDEAAHILSDDNNAAWEASSAEHGVRQ